MENRSREDALLDTLNTEGADFHLDKPRALDVGICYWPIRVIV